MPLSEAMKKYLEERKDKLKTEQYNREMKALSNITKKENMSKKSKKELKEDEERAKLASEAEKRQQRMLELLGDVSGAPEPYLYKDWSVKEEVEEKKEPEKKRGRPKKEIVEEKIIKVKKEKKPKKEVEQIEVSVPKEKKSKRSKHIFSATADLVEGSKSIQLKTDIVKGLTPKEKNTLKKSIIRAFEDHIDGSGLYVDLQGNYTTSLMTLPMSKYIDPEDNEMMKTLTRETQAPRVKPIKSGVINGSGLRIHRKTHITPNGKLLVFDTSSDEDSTDSEDEGIFHGTGLMDLIESTKNKSISLNDKFQRDRERLSNIKKK
jgi:hypothetical protein